MALPYGAGHSSTKRQGEGPRQHLLYGWSQPTARQVYHGHHTYYD